MTTLPVSIPSGLRKTFALSKAQSKVQIPQAYGIQQPTTVGSEDTGRKAMRLQ